MSFHETSNCLYLLLMLTISGAGGGPPANWWWLTVSEYGLDQSPLTDFTET